ncbi:MAG: UDP-N-acetylmuramate--L-alanine ligase [Acidimicrobiales bacterium]|nr:MAG: UDP-N-acetylmuramate--L-alanine ligase [Acidimicrobiales bacterium]
MTPDLNRSRRIHVVGAGGAGMGAIATVLHRMGHRVTGSDLKDGPVAERLRADGMTIAIGHDAANVGDAELVAISTAIPAHNPEVKLAREQGLDILRRSDLLPAICAARRTIAVAGTHGKTTTSSMLALVLVEAGLAPSFIIGGDVNEIGSGAVWDDGEWLVIEADESDKTFLSLGAEVALVTNVEPDHLETYDNDPAVLEAAFVDFATAAATRVMCIDDPGAALLAARTGATTYGTDAAADYRMIDVEPGRSSIAFTVVHDGAELGRITLPTPGEHNARNAAAAAVTALEIGAPFDAAVRALARFGGVARRFEFRGEANGITFIDDYAHLPSEVAAMVSAVREGGWDRVVCVFQPHRYSRTAALWQDFGDAFVGVDDLVLSDIYSAGETPRPGVSGKLIVDAVLDRHPWTNVAYMPRLVDVQSWLVNRLRPGDLCLTLGAGDLTGIADPVIARLRAAA